MYITDCQFGWEYDKTWYKKTAPSQENWVCDKELNVANALAVAKIGEVIGTLIFGQLGDRFLCTNQVRGFSLTICFLQIWQEEDLLCYYRYNNNRSIIVNIHISLFNLVLVLYVYW